VRAHSIQKILTASSKIHITLELDKER
jgi:hypothetical protein